MGVIVLDSKLKAVVLAAGKGTRIRTDGVNMPKVMRRALGKPLLHYVLKALPIEDKKDIVIVVGYMKEDIISAFPGYSYAVQEQQLGTGHAVISAEEAVGDFDGSILVCCGDMPLVKKETFEELIRIHFEDGNDCTMLTGTSSIPLPYGRIIRDADGCFERIVEARDCTVAQLAITELNSGIYVFRAEKLYSALKELGTDNAQHEYYLTDVPDIMIHRGDKIGVCKLDLGSELIGVNTLEQLANVEEILSLS